MLNEGLVLMAAGLGTVFGFLIILCAAVVIMSKIVEKLNKLFPEQIEEVKKAAAKISSDVEIAIAIAAAKLRK